MGKGKKKGKAAAASPSTGQKKPPTTEVDDMLDDVVDEMEDVQLSEEEEEVKPKPKSAAKKGSKVSLEEPIETETIEGKGTEEDDAKIMSRKEMKRMKKKVLKIEQQ